MEDIRGGVIGVGRYWRKCVSVCGGGGGADWKQRGRVIRLRWVQF